MNSSFTLPQLGWQPYFQQQLTLEDYEHHHIARVSAHHRSQYELWTEQGKIALPITSKLPELTVGDWILLDGNGRFSRHLERSTLISRKAAGSKLQEQHIAANLDTLLIVSSLNDDFNLSRVERYLTLAKESNIQSVIVLTKSDQCENTDDFVEQVQAIDPLLPVISINGLDIDSVAQIKPWCKSGTTTGVIGSSGVGKSTLINTLTQSELQKTGGIREDDDKGRHTTTSRSMHIIPDGGLILDTPGMRELQLPDCSQGVSSTFSDIETLALECRFGDCQHESEPGCAVKKAIDEGNLAERRLKNYFKLLREQARNGASLAEQKQKYKSLTKMYRDVQSHRRNIKSSD
ncbi:ribosome small subunit-dependent GTPase A [Vibrio penaeicida]|uniref:Small ribosomal subunit biogenesis GTPase RsgA n=1 Tax=Vibrio penaeicida TaxID=104609 RepID=A0AAV5NUD4_9VIBR|nr:ribosome small subunit-dependent GTPase A [Vibrio penaeicida]RTZ24030.1 ribosome small subunit-dependent GTPase A [Vibrio penaeicida]GLQ74212.1 putative ribosome biogenesis GTPase RsgA 2 [Vibrio penaeicida]